MAYVGRGDGEEVGESVLVVARRWFVCLVDGMKY
jgi:hypothetical protein